MKMVRKVMVMLMIKIIMVRWCLEVLVNPRRKIISIHTSSFGMWQFLYSTIRGVVKTPGYFRVRLTVRVDPPLYGQLFVNFLVCAKKQVLFWSNIPLSASGLASNFGNCNS